MNPTVNKVIQVATIAGGAALVISSAAALLKVKSPAQAIMPVVSILVGVSAFNYAIKGGSPLKVVEPAKK